jgi:uncharacterized protein YbaR (Trm112 family)
MRRDLLPLLCCPLDRAQPLAPHVFAAEGDDVLEGALVCPACGRWFAVLDGVPHLVRDGLRHVEDELDLLARHAPRLPEGAAAWRPYGPGADL